MSVDRTTVDDVAALARLRLDDDERRQLADQLGAIIDHVRRLQQVDVEGVPPTKHVVDLGNVTRDDVVGPCLTADEALANAPDSDEEHFVVPRVLPDA